MDNIKQKAELAYFGKRRLNNEENTCDKCHDIRYTENLVWITSEDFNPFVGEVIPEEAYKKYDALCDSCYESILIKN